MCTIALLASILAVTLVPFVHGQGALYNPASRGSMWRFGWGTPVNQNDHRLNCGGRQNQWEQQGGKCGVCGDPYQGPREHEHGGKYAKGIIVRTYSTNAITVTLDVYSNQLGYIEFRLCDAARAGEPVTQDCFDSTPMMIFALNSETRYYWPSKQTGTLKFDLTFPPNLPYSNHYIMQWKYKTANNWGCDPDTGRCCTGCGVVQEEFYGCADIAYVSAE